MESVKIDDLNNPIKQVRVILMVMIGFLTLFIFWRGGIPLAAGLLPTNLAEHPMTIHAVFGTVSVIAGLVGITLPRKAFSDTRLAEHGEDLNRVDEGILEGTLPKHWQTTTLFSLSAFQTVAALGIAGAIVLQQPIVSLPYTISALILFAFHPPELENVIRRAQELRKAGVDQGDV